MLVEDKTIKNPAAKVLFQCQACLTIYDQTLGDPDAGVPTGTPFERLPNTYQCPLCQSERTTYRPLM